jgi:uncharacterized protein
MNGYSKTEQRRLGPEDATLLEAFLVGHRDSSMFLRSNAQRAGLEDRGEALQATYVGSFREGKLVGVAAHCWNGMLLVQASEGLADAARLAVAQSGRGVTGFSGPVAQVKAARAALGLEEVPAQLEEEEGLFSLQLSGLSVPEALRNGQVECRAPLPRERDTLVAWRVAYDVEALGSTPSEAVRNGAGEVIDRMIAEQNAWVALNRGLPVSFSAFNAVLPDIVQRGGIYTPPEQRGRGYAKAAVACSLLVAIERGATRAVLFTKNPSAVHSYEALGFRRTGDYGLILLGNAPG